MCVGLSKVISTAGHSSRAVQVININRSSDPFFFTFLLLFLKEP